MQTTQQHADSTGLRLADNPVPLTAFVSPEGKGGNPCQLIIHPEPIDPDTNHPETTTSIINCHCWPRATSEHNSLVVQCYNPQGLIQCCGHGLLCSAYWWLLRQPEQTLALQMNDSRLTAHYRDNCVWLHFKRLPTRRCPPPGWAAELFPDRPIAAATAGGEQGYLILQWPADYPLQHLPRPDHLLAQHSQRALIVTAADTLLPGIDIQFRYFAPQYGSNEDPATGSAMRLLADYWQHQHNPLAALQCSPGTGTLFSRTDNNTISVGGYCRQGYEP
jgi:predicted PhzF superfamily epimerase YddE/YHI9